MKVFEINYGGKVRKLMFGFWAHMLIEQKKDAIELKKAAELIDLPVESLSPPLFIYAAIKCFQFANPSHTEESVTLQDCIIWFNTIDPADVGLLIREYAASQASAKGLEAYTDGSEKKKASA